MNNHPQASLNFIWKSVKSINNEMLLMNRIAYCMRQRSCETFQDTIVYEPLSTYPLLSVKTSQATARMDEVTTKKFFKRVPSSISIPTTVDILIIFNCI